MVDTKGKILVVDDDPLGRDTIEALLAPEGYDLLTASSGLDALTQASRTTPDLILLDIMMPGMDGYEACRRLRSDPAVSEVPIILITALDDRESKLQGIRAGADDFVSKPIDRVELRARIRTIIRLNRFRRLLLERERREEVEQSLKESERELRLLSTRLLEAQETERKRIARELHDSIGQSLSAIKLNVENVLARWHEHCTDLMKESLQDLVGRIRGTVEEVRRISMDLRPSILDDLGIIATIGWLSREFETAHPKLSIEKRIDLREEEIPVELKTVIYRILQEALNNAANHSRAQLITLSLKGNHQGIELMIVDDGIGFDPENVYRLEESRRGLGLASMRERAQLSGGGFSIQSAASFGTRICTSWPLVPATAH